MDTVPGGRYVTAFSLICILGVMIVGARWAQEESSMATIIGSVAAWVAFLGSVYFFYRNREMTYKANERAVTIEAQKLLLEINKQYVADPTLLVLEGISEEESHLATGKLRAMAYLKLNVFEIIFKSLEDEDARDTWISYFEESLSKSPLLGEELDLHRKIYNQYLLKAYDNWRQKEGRHVATPMTKTERRRTP
jgi:hypothetical protein